MKFGWSKNLALLIIAVTSANAVTAVSVFGALPIEREIQTRSGVFATFGEFLGLRRNLNKSKEININDKLDPLYPRIRMRPFDAAESVQAESAYDKNRSQFDSLDRIQGNMLVIEQLAYLVAKGVIAPEYLLSERLIQSRSLNPKGEQFYAFVPPGKDESPHEWIALGYHERPVTVEKINNPPSATANFVSSFFLFSMQGSSFLTTIKFVDGREAVISTLTNDRNEKLR